MSLDMSTTEPTDLDDGPGQRFDIHKRVIGRTHRTGKIHTAYLLGDQNQISCRHRGKNLVVPTPLATSPTDLGHGLIAALATFHPHPDQLCTACFRGIYDTVTVRLSHAGRVDLARRFSRNLFTEDTETAPAPEPDADGHHAIRLSYHARSVIAGLVAPNGDREGQVWHDGIVTDVWDEIAAAFPRSLARTRRRSQRELSRTFPLHWFTAWAELHPYDAEQGGDVGNYYDPEFGL